MIRVGRHLPDSEQCRNIASRLPIDDMPLAWANAGAVYVDLQDLSLTPDDADTLADAIHAAASEARQQ